MIWPKYAMGAMAMVASTLSIAFYNAGTQPHKDVNSSFSSHIRTVESDVKFFDLLARLRYFSDGGYAFQYSYIGHDSQYHFCCDVYTSEGVFRIPISWVKADAMVESLVRRYELMYR